MTEPTDCEKNQALSQSLRELGLFVLSKREAAWLTAMLLVAGFCIGRLLP